MIEGLRRPGSKMFKQFGFVIASHKKTLRAGSSEGDEFGASVVSADSRDHEMGAQLPAPGSHMLRSKTEWDEGFSLHVSLISEENVSQKTPSQLPLGAISGAESPFPAWFLGRRREWTASSWACGGGGGAA